MVYIMLFIISWVQFSVGDVRIVPTRNKITVREGDNFPFIRCSSGCRRSCTYTWYRVHPYQEVIHSGPQMLKGTLANMKNNGKYVCQVEEKWRQTQRSKEFEIVVTEVKIPLVSVGNHQNITILQGETFTLRVYIEYRTRTTNITLLKDGQEVKTLQTSTDNDDFVLPEVSCNDTGSYRVKVINHIGQSLSEIVALKVLCNASLTTNYKSGSSTDNGLDVRKSSSTSRVTVNESIHKESNIDDTTSRSTSKTSFNGTDKEEPREEDDVIMTSYIDYLNGRSTKKPERSYKDSLTSHLIMNGSVLYESKSAAVDGQDSSHLLTNDQGSMETIMSKQITSSYFESSTSNVLKELKKDKDVFLESSPSTTDGGTRKIGTTITMVERITLPLTRNVFIPGELNSTLNMLGNASKESDNSMMNHITNSVVSENSKSTKDLITNRNLNPIGALRQQSKSSDDDDGWINIALVATFVAGALFGIVGFIALKRFRRRLGHFNIQARDMAIIEMTQAESSQSERKAIQLDRKETCDEPGSHDLVSSVRETKRSPGVPIEGKHLNDDNEENIFRETSV